ncbi:MFS transporter [Streptomyces sulfonofaciens]|uniref:MFS transporter n=1 Tax=Streptomyces sulfonofaciens TaxID=68272 RepID=A0A919FYY2_9ACTN|nr:RbtT/DalT/CsbX family MFS transporter [Streptomyces sulfonofaciens]GHH74538.1 MFS transporter [Streptomyces sulfonofaciens]
MNEPKTPAAGGGTPAQAGPYRGPSTAAPLRGVERVGIPRPLLWGFVAVFVYMVGDGVEISYLTDYLQRPDGGGLADDQASFATVTAYGIAVMIASWFSGTLSAIWGPRRVMWLGAGWWVVFEAVFLFLAVPSHSLAFIATVYGVRGFAYPLFAFAFLVWAQTVSPERMRGSVAGWFWFAFTGGLPTLGAGIAALAIGPLGMSLYATLVLSLVLVAVGGAIGSFAVREPQGLRPIADPGMARPRSYRRLAEGVDILWRDKRTLAGAVVRIVNTAPEFGFFAMLPFTFGTAHHHDGFLTAAQISTLTAIMYGANIAANLAFGVFGDRFGWRRTVTVFGCVGCAVATPLWYFASLASESFAVTVVLGCVYCVLLAGFVPLSALMPSMVRHKDKGAALAVLNFGAGGAAFVGPALVTVFHPVIGGGGVTVVFSVLYLAVAVVSTRLKDASDPGERRRAAAPGAAVSGSAA